MWIWKENFLPFFLFIEILENISGFFFSFVWSHLLKMDISFPKADNRDILRGSNSLILWVVKVLDKDWHFWKLANFPHPRPVFGTLKISLSWFSGLRARLKPTKHPFRYIVHLHSATTTLQTLFQMVRQGCIWAEKKSSQTFSFRIWFFWIASLRPLSQTWINPKFLESVKILFDQRKSWILFLLEKSHSNVKAKKWMVPIHLIDNSISKRADSRNIGEWLK